MYGTTSLCVSVCTYVCACLCVSEFYNVTVCLYCMHSRQMSTTVFVCVCACVRLQKNLVLPPLHMCECLLNVLSSLLCMCFRVCVCMCTSVMCCNGVVGERHTDSEDPSW